MELTDASLGELASVIAVCPDRTTAERVVAAELSNSEPGESDLAAPLRRVRDDEDEIMWEDDLGTVVTAVAATVRQSVTPD